MKVADGEHIRKVFVLSADDVAAGAEVAERVEATVGSTGSPTTKVTEIPSNIEVGAGSDGYSAAGSVGSDSADDRLDWSAFRSPPFGNIPLLRPR